MARKGGTVSALSYMQRRSSGIYEFRRMLPRSLAGREPPAAGRERLKELINPSTGRFKREITISLRTTDVAEGKRRDRSFVVWYRRRRRWRVCRRQQSQ